MSLDAIFSKLKQLPTMPALLHELMQEFANENAKIEDIAKKISMDQSISARVLKMANSVVYSRGIEVTSIDQAVIRIGFKQVSSLVIATALNNSFKTPKSFDKNKFWIDTFQIATIAKSIARESKKIEPETAFTCALIHNIGELLVQQCFPTEAELINAAVANGCSRIDAQRETIGYDYSQLGAELVRRWKLPEFFVHSTEQHLNPMEYDDPNPGALIIRLAIFVEFAVNAGVPADIIIKRFPSSITSKLEIDPSRLVDQINAASEGLNELAEILTSA
ncbi:MAG: HDOD domain-containing protein [Succinivibrionaceae bacterium]|nr:HDOD domain-containing protein [Succinivibrionaceae bacterium]